MGVNTTDPKTPIEKAEAAANLVEQMSLAHRMGDIVRFKDVHAKCSRILHELVEQLDSAA